jgi:MATE family multidrug resistance protein
MEAGGSLVHILLVLLFVNTFGWGFTGICWATSIHFSAQWIFSYVQINYIWVDLRDKHGTSVFAKESTENLGRQFNIDFMGMLMGVWGWWAFDIFTLMASYLSITAISAQTIMRSIGLLTYMIPVGLELSLGILLGNAIGAGSVYKFKFYYKLSLVCALIAALTQNVLLFAFKDPFIAIFTDKQPVADAIKSVWFIFNLCVIADCLQGV